MTNEIIRKLLAVDRETFAVVIDFLDSMSGKRKDHFKKALASDKYEDIIGFLPKYRQDLEDTDWTSFENIYTYMRNE